MSGMSEASNLHFPALSPAPGLVRRVGPGEGGLELIDLAMLRLGDGQEHPLIPDRRERVLIILTGRAEMRVEGLSSRTIGGRMTVFEDRAWAVYLPAGCGGTVRGVGPAEVAVAAAPGSRDDFAPRIIAPDEVVEKKVGRDNWSRHVYDIIGGDFPAERLIVGETINPPGNWSSSPPHKHDRHDPPNESKFEEVYLYRFDPPRGFGLQRVYSPDHVLDETYTVQHDDVVTLPRGYHPVVAGPGYRLYYLWILAGQGREPVWFEDPDHSWINTA